MAKDHGLSEKTVQAVCAVLSRHPEVEEAVLFGSRAKGTHRPGSDIDLALRGPRLSQRLVDRVHGDLDDLSIPHMVSLVLDDESLDSDVRAHIERAGVLFYQKTATAKMP